MDKAAKILDDIKDQDKKVMDLLLKQKQDNSRQFSKITEKFDGIYQRFNGVHQQFDGVSEQFHKVNSRLDRVEPSIIDTQEIVGENTKDIKALKFTVDLTVTNHELCIGHLETIFHKQ